MWTLIAIALTAAAFYVLGRTSAEAKAVTHPVVAPVTPEPARRFDYECAVSRN